MRIRTIVGMLSLLLLSPLIAAAHPGAGLVALDANTVVFPDPINNVLWRLEKGKQPFPLVKGLHVHWVTKGLDGHLYAESFGEIGGALFRIDASTGAKVKVADGSEIDAHVFAVGKDGEIIFQKDGGLVERRRDGTVKPFRGSGGPARGQRPLRTVISYFWDRETLVFSDGNTINLAKRNGELSFGVPIDGPLISPRIWNSTGESRIWSIAMDTKKSWFLALPDLGRVVRYDSNGERVLIRSEGGWRATAVAAYGDNVFVSESSDRSNDGPRIRVIRPSGVIEVLGEVKVAAK